MSRIHKIYVVHAILNERIKLLPREAAVGGLIRRVIDDPTIQCVKELDILNVLQSKCRLRQWYGEDSSIRMATCWPSRA